MLTPFQMKSSVNERGNEYSQLSAGWTLNLPRIFVAPSHAFDDIATLATNLEQSVRAIESLNARVRIQQDILDAIADARKGLLCTLFREQSRRTDEIRSLHLPFQVIPKSLHPDE
jgi:hypothetical protein